MDNFSPPENGRAVLLKGGCVLTLAPGLGDFEQGDVLIEAGRIAQVAREIDAPEAFVVDAHDYIVAPGFVDSHRHLWEGLIRNSMPDATLADYFREVNGRFGPAYRPEDVYAGTLISALSALDAGVTTVLDWAQIQNSPEHTDASVQALTDAGIRAVFGYGFPTVKEGHAFPQDAVRLRKGRFASNDQLLTLALATQGPEMVPHATVKEQWGLARELAIRISVHVGLEKVSKPGQIEQFGREGWLAADTTYVHCAALNPTEWRMIADTGGTVSISAPIELQMGHGAPPIDRALAAGIRPSLSVDVETSMSTDLFTQMRSVLSLQRGGAHARLHAGAELLVPRLTARDVLEFATLEGAKANGLERKIGSLEPGKQADIILLRTKALNVMPLNDAVGAIVLGMDSSNVDTVIVGGRFRKWRGRLLGVDLDDLQDIVTRRRGELFARCGHRIQLCPCGPARANVPHAAPSMTGA